MTVMTRFTKGTPSSHTSMPLCLSSIAGLVNLVSSPYNPQQELICTLMYKHRAHKYFSSNFRGITYVSSFQTVVPTPKLTSMKDLCWEWTAMGNSMSGLPRSSHVSEDERYKQKEEEEGDYAYYNSRQNKLFLFFNQRQQIRIK